MAPGRNILIFHAGALGDFVVTWPLALALARLHPQSRLFYVTQEGKGALAEKALRLESVDSESGWHPLFAPGAELAEGHARRLAGAHTIVTFVSSGDDAWAGNVRRLSPAELIPLAVAPPAEFAGHVTDHLLAQLAPWPAAQAALAQVLRSIAERGVSGLTGNPAGPVVVHPGSGAPRKCWPADRFLSLIGRLRAAGRDVRVLLGEAELEKWPAAEIDRFAAAAALARTAGYVELFEELKTASAFVGNDTGPSHLAGIIGLPTVALFGPSNPTHWRPLGPRVHVLQAPALDQIAVEQVYGQATRALSE
jgi:ADP-heptose:LPS heptosyltransferase